MNESEFDQRLRAALLEANRRDWSAELEGPEPAEPLWSHRHLRRMDRLLADPVRAARRAGRPGWKRVLRAAAVAALAACLTFGGALAVSPAFREQVYHWFMESYSTHNSYVFSGEQPEEDIGEWTFGALPEGFEETERHSSGGYRGSVVYQDSQGRDMRLTYIYMAVANIYLDNERHVVTKTMVNGHLAEVYMSTEELSSNMMLLFDQEEGIVFLIEAWEDYDGMIALAESIQRVE